MKTAISLPDPLFAEAERLASRLKTSRSRLYRDAIAEYVARHDSDEITDAINRVSAGTDTSLDAFGRTAARKGLRRTEW